MINYSCVLRETCDVTIHHVLYRIEILESQTHKPKFMTKVYELNNGAWTLSEVFPPDEHGNSVGLIDDRVKEIDNLLTVEPPSRR